MPLKFDGANNLNQLSSECASGQMITQPRQLHGDGGSAAMNSARSQTKGCPHQCYRVDSRMMPIVLVFELESGIDQCRRNIWQRSPDPKFLIGRQRDTKQFSVAIANTLRE